MPGQRNLALFDHVRFWAYKASLGRDLDEWHKRVEYHANNLNRFFSVSLETQEVGDIAYSVATWTWARPALNHAPEVQAARGRRSGQSRRDAKAGRNLTIRDLKDDGWTVEDIAAIIGIHQRTVYRAMQSQQPTLIRSVSTDTNQSGGGGGGGWGGSPGGDMSMGKQRRTQEEMDTLRAAILAVAQADRPVSVRHIFYRMVTQNLVEKSDRGYQQLQKGTVDMRDAGALPYSWIEDSSRRAYMNTGYAGVGSFAEVAASIYRRNYWESTDTLVEVWCESRSLAGVLGQVCREYVVPLFPSGGFASLSFLYQAAAHIQEAGRANAVILYVGDYDQAGVLIDKAIESRLRDFLAAWGGELTFRRLAVNDDQIDRMGLPTRPPKASDTRSPEVTRAVEAEAIPAPAMREIVSSSLQGLIPERVLTVSREVEKQERNDIYSRLLR